MERVLNHRTQGGGYKFLTIMKGEPHRDAKCQPTSDFVDKDRTVTEVLARLYRGEEHFAFVSLNSEVVDGELNRRRWGIVYRTLFINYRKRAMSIAARRIVEKPLEDLRSNENI